MSSQTISAKIIAHSVSKVSGKEIVTFELEYPRFIHSELMTHRMFSRNAASSRAIPVEKMIEQVRQFPAAPIHWGKNQSGMQAKEEIQYTDQWCAEEFWWIAANNTANVAENLNKLSLHKQIVNRILEPFQWMKTVVTATEFDNFFWLRNHPDAQPEIKKLAEVMLEALQNSAPYPLSPGDWHVPYYIGTWGSGIWLERKDTDTLENALAISSSCAAQVSYRKLDDSLEKAQMIYKRLVESEPVHASPFEHCATPMQEHFDEWGIDIINSPGFPLSWEQGITHVDRDRNLWSGNFKSWIQYRQLIPNNVCKEYKNE